MGGADQSSASSCAELATEFSGVALDMLVNCAGVGGSGPNLADFSRDGQEFGAIDYEAWVRVWLFGSHHPPREGPLFVTYLTYATGSHHEHKRVWRHAHDRSPSELGGLVSLLTVTRTSSARRCAANPALCVVPTYSYRSRVCC